ncbi:MAG TPA: ABC transporter permease [Sphingomonadaceae bacterium]|nr:ABC transporter permease [Sphingomonadaceae bacterium]
MSAGFDRRRFRAMLVKEARQIVRDPSTFLIAFVLPILLIFLFGFGVNLDTARTDIGLSRQDDGAAARALAGAFQHSRWFAVRQTGAIEPLENALVAGEVHGIVVIPNGFSREAAAGGGDIQVITDGSSPNTAGFVASYADGVRASWAAARAAERGQPAAPPIALVPRFWFNPALASRYFLVPGAIAIVMTMIGSLLTALIIAREWERGTMEAIMATPLGMGEFIASKVIPYFLLGIGSMTVCTLIAIAVFGVPLRGSPLALLVIASAFLIPALGLGLLISATTKNQFVASQIALLTAFLPGMLLSGFLFEIPSMPRWVQAITYAVPARYLIPPLQTVFAAGDNWGLFLPDIAAMLGFGLLFFTLAIRANRRRIA